MYPTLRPGYKRGVLEAIEFKVLTDDAILNNSVIEKDKGLTSNETTGQHGIPRRGSATDPRLGTTDIFEISVSVTISDAPSIDISAIQ